jgi:glutathione S-transferase
MRKLYYHPLCAASRTVSFALSEKRLDFTTEIIRFWDKSSGLCELNPLGRLPVLIELNGSVLAGVYGILEYIEEKYAGNSVLSQDSNERAEARRIFQWLNEDFAAEVTAVLAFEKGLKKFFVAPGNASPSSAVLKQVRDAIQLYVRQLEWFAERRRWLAGDAFSFADIAAAAHVSLLDYMGGVNWNIFPIAKEWYVRIKSRPSFRRLLNERIPGIAPAAHYAVLDF